MTPPINEIIEVIKELPLKEALAYLLSKDIYDYTKKGYGKISKLIRDKQNEGKYVFVPNKKECTQLLELGRNPEYQELEYLIQRYKYIDILRTGLLIDYYHRNDNPKNRRRVVEIKNHIQKKPNGSYFLKLVNLPTTPFFSVIIGHLHDLMLPTLKGGDSYVG